MLHHPRIIREAQYQRFAFILVFAILTLSWIGAIIFD